VRNSLQNLFEVLGGQNIYDSLTGVPGSGAQAGNNAGNNQLN
jgi:hypothetical protein